MVSKIAVIALVAVVAVPILLGYGLNINTDTYDSWNAKDTGKIDATEFLYNVTDTSKRDYTPADLYLFNSQGFYIDDYNFFPEYESITANNTSIPIRGLARALGGANDGIATLSDEFVQLVVNGGFNASNYYRFTFTHTDNTTETIDHIAAFTWRTNANYGSTGTSATASVVFYTGGGAGAGVTLDNLTSVRSTFIGSSAPGVYQQWHYTTMSGYYADISKGWRLNTGYPVSTSASSPRSGTYIQPDGICKDMLLTFNLDSITANNYWMGVYMGTSTVGYHIQLIKETVDSTSTWYYQISGDDERHALYYDPGISTNTYQLYLDPDGGEFRYVGAWTDNISPMQPLITYPFTLEEGAYYWPYPDALPRLSIYGQTPTMRIDYANVAAFEYRIIRDVTYVPANFISNPLTVFSNLLETGPSFDFGGENFTVTKGNITMGDGKQVSLRNMRLSSVPNGNGQYINTINDIEVSVTNAPAQITFNGDWRMTITTVGQEETTKTVSKWEPGKFAWNGIDTDFKIAGLMASLGVFVALAVYGRRSGSNVIPLLLICGGAALMFLVMI